jgi:predicted nuclease of predicted toxin-antitoxin system
VVYVHILKFIADVNVEKAVVDFLRTEGYDVKWIPDFNRRMPDESLLKLANKERRILVTNDKDFGELTFLQRKCSAGVILIRVKGRKTSDKVKLMEKVLKGHRDKLANHFVVASKTKFRFIPMEVIR